MLCNLHNSDRLHYMSVIGSSFMIVDSNSWKTYYHRSVEIIDMVLRAVKHCRQLTCIRYYYCVSVYVHIHNTKFEGIDVVMRGTWKKNYGLFYNDRLHVCKYNIYIWHVMTDVPAFTCACDMVK